MKRIGGLRKRWLLNTAGIVLALGLVCVLVVTLVFYAYYYSGMESDLRYRARTTSDFFAEFINQSYDEYYQSCVDYANNFEQKNTIELQFVDVDGKVVASSYGHWAGQDPITSDINSALSSRQISTFIGKDPYTKERIIAVSSPMVYRNGEIIGVLRYVTSTKMLDRHLVRIFLYSLGALCAVMLVVVLSSNYFIRSILRPVKLITEKAKRITNGSYGIQIEAKYKDEIGELVDTINEMSVQISQNERMQREFISSLSHELRTPLTAINGWSETLLQNEELDQETVRGMNIILRETKRLTEMVVELLDFTRIQDGKMTLNMVLSDIRGEFEDTVFMYSSRLSQDGIQLEYLDSDEEIPEITCDPEKLRQVFLNILDNAAKHGGEGKRITASIGMDQDMVVIQVRDFGPGIPEDELPLVKHKFYKGSSKARGTGIGLALCEEIVLMHNGILTLENAEGGGTLVRVCLPAAQ